MMYFLAHRNSNMTAGANQTGGDFYIPFSHVTGKGRHNFATNDAVKLLGSSAISTASGKCGYMARYKGHYNFYAQALITNVEVLGKLTMGLIVTDKRGIRKKIYKVYDIAKELSGTSTNGVTYDVQASLELNAGDLVSVSLNFDNAGQDTFVINADTNNYKTFFTGYMVGV